MLNLQELFTVHCKESRSILIYTSTSPPLRTYLFVFLYVSAWRAFHEAAVMCWSGGWEFLLVSVCFASRPICPHIPPRHTLHLSVHYQSHRRHTAALQLTFDEENIEWSGVSLNRFFGREFWSDDVPLAVEFHTVHFRYHVGYNRLTMHYSISVYYIEYTIIGRMDGWMDGWIDL